MSASQHPNLIDIEIAVQGGRGRLLGLFQKSLAASSIVAACECPSRATLCGIQRNVSFMNKTGKKGKKKRIKGSFFDFSSPLHRAWFSFPPFTVCFICCLGCGGVFADKWASQRKHWIYSACAFVCSSFLGDFFGRLFFFDIAAVTAVTWALLSGRTAVDETYLYTAVLTIVQSLAVQLLSSNSQQLWGSLSLNSWNVHLRKQGHVFHFVHFPFFPTGKLAKLTLFHSPFQYNT